MEERHGALVRMLGIPTQSHEERHGALVRMLGIPTQSHEERHGALVRMLGIPTQSHDDSGIGKLYEISNVLWKRGMVLWSEC